jgi:aspartate/methionine/tyrosine aminotransferase
VAVTPGRDFGSHRAQDFVRIAYTAPIPALDAALQLVADFTARMRARRQR